jgi:hypothetical protein
MKGLAVLQLQVVVSVLLTMDSLAQLQAQQTLEVVEAVVQALMEWVRTVAPAL